MNLITFLISTCCALDIALAQLFPFSPLRHYIDQRNTNSEVVSTTSKSPSLDRYRYAEDASLSSGSQVPNINRAVVDDKEVRIVAVTPKPKYAPRRLIPEPNVDPNTHWIPNIGYKGPSLSSFNQQSPQSTSLSVKTKPDEQVRAIPALSTIVESIPSLSVTIPLDGGHKKVSGLIDYLVPPKYPSVYENHLRQNEVPSVQSATKVLTGASTATTLKPKKSKIKRKRPYKEQTGETDKNSNTEKRVRNRFRPSRTRPTSTVRPSLDEPNASATSFYHTNAKPYFNTPIHIPMPQSNAAIGLGASSGERVEFQLHGQSGPDSYKFGFDTGDVKNRHFRYEEKDNNGNVKGHYGYYDKTGKLQIISYHADENGFHATSQ